MGSGQCGKLTCAAPEDGLIALCRFINSINPVVPG